MFVRDRRHLIGGIDGIFIATVVPTVNVHGIVTPAIQKLQRKARMRMAGLFLGPAEVNFDFNAEAFVPCLPICGRTSVAKYVAAPAMSASAWALP